MTFVERNALEYPDFYLHLRLLPDGRAVWIQRQIFTYAITIGHADDGFGYDTEWTYETEERALAALKKWNPLEQAEPEGWHRHPDSGRRRPDGDPAKEYVRP